MPPRSSTAKIAYVALAAADTYLAGQGTKRAKRLRYLTKPLLMPALATAFASSTTGRRDVLRQSALGAQAFSWGGDLALMGGSERAFLGGVGSFFAAHTAYITGFASAGSFSSASASDSAGLNSAGLKTAAAMWVATAPVMTIAAGHKDPALRVPIAAYGTVLAAMYAASTMLDQDLPRNARRKVMLGTSLFLASDTVLGLRKFLLDDHSPALESVVMATYSAGQWFIADGVASAR